MQFNFGGVSITQFRGSGLVGASEDFRSRNGIVPEMVTTNGDANLENSTLLKGISARGSITVEGGEIVGETRSTMDGVTGTKAVFGSIEARDNIKLDDCTARAITSTMGDIILEGASKISEAINARDDVKIRDRCEIQGQISSSMGSVRAESSTLWKVRARDNINLERCTAHEVSSTMGNVTIRSSVVTGAVTTRDHLELENSSVDNVRSSQGDVRILGKQDDYAAKSVEARGSITLQNTRVVEVVSGQGKVTAKDASVDASITARDGADLTNTDAHSVTVRQGSLKVKRSAATEFQNYYTLSVRERINATNISAGLVQCDGGSEFINCTIGKLTLDVGPDSPVKVALTDSTVNGDLIVKVDPNRRGGSFNTFINSSGYSGLTVNGGGRFGAISVTTADIVIDNGRRYSSVADLSEGDKQLILLAGEGGTGRIGGLDVIVKGGKVVPRASVPITLAEIERMINSMLGSGNFNRAEINGGIYSRQDGKLSVIKAPPGFAEPEVASSSAPEPAKKIQLQISGGEIRGKIRFEGCQGEYTLVDGATLLEDNG